MQNELGDAERDATLRKVERRREEVSREETEIKSLRRGKNRVSGDAP